MSTAEDRAVTVDFWLPCENYIPPASCAAMSRGNPSRCVPCTERLRVLDALDEARAEVERLRQYAPSREMAELLERGSLGSDEARAARESVSADAGHAIVKLSKVMAERDAATARIDAALAIHTAYYPRTSTAPSLVARCAHCDSLWPCATATALGVTE